MTAYGLGSDELADWVQRSRAAQGLGPRVTDPAVLDRVARLVWADRHREAS